ncbi:MAG: non-canonical purine NTP diphosphatase [Bacteroidales bacterium]|jgi:XTP/dITP diphosphohydrolase|nr:non-canonical purine NTP diphosphatase [Bacteroidales bacterium]
MEKIVFATNNKNKLHEIQHLLKDVVNVLSLSDIGFDEDIAETEDTLQGNALLKAEAIFSKFGHNVFSDDTGLEIDALNGEPGIYSARYAGKACDPEANMAQVLENLRGKENRSARFRTAIALILNGKRYIFEGKVEGKILTERQGEQGFGYDPIFQPEGYDETFAQLSLSIKNVISHRGLAIKKLVAFLKEQ